MLLAASAGMRWIEDQVATILDQVGPSVTLFISVDKSTDGTHDWCEAISLKHENVHVLEHGQVFGGAAKNFFRLIRDVDFIRYDYIAFSDQDDLWAPDKLQRAISIIEKIGFDAFSSDVTAFWETGKSTLIKKSFPQKKYDYFFESAGPGCTYVLTRDTAIIFKEFLISNWVAANKVQLHDWLIYAFCRSRLKRWYIDDVPLMRYRQHTHNQLGANAGIGKIAARFAMIWNGWYRQEIEKIVALVDPNNEVKFFLTKLFLIKNLWGLRRRQRDAWLLLLTIVLGIF